MDELGCNGAVNLKSNHARLDINTQSDRAIEVSLLLFARRAR
jgi:hypothetical protein